jgi:hypothetical protein
MDSNNLNHSNFNQNHYLLFWSWEVCAILFTYEQIITITKFVASSSNIVFVSSKVVVGIKRNRKVNLINLCNNSKSLIISMNLSNIKNMIHLSNFKLDELSNLFSCKDLRDSSFQDTIIKIL